MTVKRKSRTAKPTLKNVLRVAQNFKPFSEGELANLRTQAAKLAGPMLEDWKRATEQHAGLNRPIHTDG